MKKKRFPTFLLRLLLTIYHPPTRSRRQRLLACVPLPRRRRQKLLRVRASSFSASWSHFPAATGLKPPLRPHAADQKRRIVPAYFPVPRCRRQKPPAPLAGSSPPARARPPSAPLSGTSRPPSLPPSLCFVKASPFVRSPCLPSPPPFASWSPFAAVGKSAPSPASRHFCNLFECAGEICDFGVLRVFCNQFGGSWLPVFSAAKAKKSDEEYHWVMGLNASKVSCIVCKAPESYPMVASKPVLKLFNLSFPLASSDLGAADLENEFIKNNLHLSQVQNTIGALAAAGQDTDALEDEAFNTEAVLTGAS